MLQAYWLYIEHVLNTYWTRTEHILHIYWKLHRACFRSMFNMLNTYCRHIEDVLKIIVQYVKYILNTCCRYVETYSSIYVECILQYIVHMLHIRCICIAKVSRMRHQNVYEWDLEVAWFLKKIHFLNCVHKTINLPNSLSYTKLAKKTLPRRHIPSWIKLTHNTIFIVESWSWRWTGWNLAPPPQPF